MKIINVDRGRGKTTRALFLSEYLDVPILCANTRYKRMLIDVASQHSIKIPNPLSVDELHTKSRLEDISTVIVDEIPMVLHALVDNVAGKSINIECATISAGKIN